MNMFLTANEIVELTGYQVAHYQACWLTSHGYPFELTNSGKPRVLRAYVEQRLGLTTVVPLSNSEPDFSHWQQPKAA